MQDRAPPQSAERFAPPPARSEPPRPPQLCNRRASNHINDVEAQLRASISNDRTPARPAVTIFFPQSRDRTIDKGRLSEQHLRQGHIPRNSGRWLATTLVPPIHQSLHAHPDHFTPHPSLETPSRRTDLPEDAVHMFHNHPHGTRMQECFQPNQDFAQQTNFGTAARPLVSR